MNSPTNIGVGYTDRTLSKEEAREILAQAFAEHDMTGKRVLLITPDATRSAPMPMMFRLFYEALADKVAAQQAYVLIFGPLKSGKSTLMNAIAATYVSEVSSLPAYPCLVFVHNGERREYVVADYSGTTQTFGDSEGLRQRIRSAQCH